MQRKKQRWDHARCTNRRGRGGGPSPWAPGREPTLPGAWGLLQGLWLMELRILAFPLSSCLDQGDPGGAGAPHALGAPSGECDQEQPPGGGSKAWTTQFRAPDRSLNCNPPQTHPFPLLLFPVSQSPLPPAFPWDHLPKYLLHANLRLGFLRFHVLCLSPQSILS